MCSMVCRKYPTGRMAIALLNAGSITINSIDYVAGIGH
jgi:hypothetical protein